MIYYAIRHKATGKLMPLAKRGKGYSHWNPGNPNAHKLEAELGVPRIIDTLRHAKSIIVAWVSMPNAHYTYRSSIDGGDYDIDITPDGRTKDDLEVVEIEFNIKED